MPQLSTYETVVELAKKKHVSNNDFLEFQKFIEDLAYDEIELLITDRLEAPEGLQLVNLIFSGLSQKSNSQKKRVKLFELLLTQIQNNDLFPRCVTGILTWLAIEIPKLSSAHLVRVCDLCVDSISKTTKPQRASWHELLPKLLNVLVEKNELDHYGTETNGEEYKKQVVSAIHQAKWNPEILTPIAAMFTNINLTDEEHLKVVSKLCQSMDSLMPEEIPPLVYQLLLLTANRNAMSVFFALKKYYNQRIYGLNDSSSMLDTDRAVVGVTTREESEIEPSLNGLTESEAMVLYHIEVVAQRSLGCIPELMKCAKTSIPCAELFFDPFLIAVLLIISNVPTYEAQVTEVLQKMIVRLVNEEEKRNDSDWLRKVLNTYCDTQGIICKLIKSKACELEGVMRGFLSLSISLLKTSNKTVAHYGRLIACNLVSKHIVVASGVLEAVTTNIFSTPEITQFAECLDEVCDSSPMTVVDYPKMVNRLLEALPNLPEPAASKVIYALISLLRVSSRLRDNLLMVLRKALFVHNTSTRTLAVSGFLQLLKRMRIKGMYTMSQNSFQAYTCPSVFATQSLVDVHVQNTNNEGICLEVIQVLKRCFSLELSVKVQFYCGLHSALMKNPELCIPITEIFLEHLKTFYEPDVDKLPPLNFSKAISIIQDKISVNEPLGHLVFVVQKIVNTSDELMSGIVDDEEYIANMTKLQKMLKSLVERFSVITLSHLDLDKDLDNKDLSGPEGQMKEEILRQCLSIFQALICFVVSKWDITSSQSDLKSLLSLHKACANFEDFAKTSKLRKDELSKKKSKDSSTQSSSSLGKRAHFQFPETVIDFDTVFRLLSVMLDDVDWCMEEMANELKKKPSLLRFALHSCLDMLQIVKNKLKVTITKTTLEELTKLGRLIFRRVMKRFEEVKEFDPASSALAVEVYTEILSILFTFFRRNRTSFLQQITAKPDHISLDELLQSTLKPYISTLNNVVDDADSSDEPSYKGLVSSLVTGINILALELPVTGSCINKTYRWLLDFAQTKTLPVLAEVKTLLTLLFTLLSKAKSEATLHDNLALQLCRAFGSINDTELEEGTVTLEMVNEITKTTAYCLLCNMLNGRLDAVDWIVTRVKAETALISQPDCSPTDPTSRKAVLSRKEKELVTELGLVVSASHWICTAAVPADCAEVACKLLVHVYSSLVAFTKYFSIRGSTAYTDARFAKLVQLSSHLSAQIADFLLYIESVDIDNDDNPKKKFSSKVLRQAKKMTVYIPKLVAELENFSKCVTQLSTKFKDNELLKNVKLTTTRDFRLNSKKLEEAMKRGHESDDDDNDISSIAGDVSINQAPVGSQTQSRADPQPSTSTQRSSVVSKGSQAKRSRPAGKGKKPKAASSQASKKRRTV